MDMLFDRNLTWIMFDIVGWNHHLFLKSLVKFQI